MRVLVVDDDIVDRLVTAAMVGLLGHDCRSAGDAAEAWVVLEGGGVDAVISDRMMPGMDGLGLCRRIREELPETGVYVVLATGVGGRGRALEGMLAGADDYLTKPVSLHDLRLRLTAVERLRAGHQNRSKELPRQSEAPASRTETPAAAGPSPRRGSGASGS